MSRRLPARAFQSQRAPAWLNVLAVGASLAAVTAALFHALWPQAYVGAAVSTFVTGTLWAALMRALPEAGRVRTGRVLSPVLACTNAMLCVAFLSLDQHPVNLLATLLSVVLGGGLVGAVIWLPACGLTMLLFGLPIARAQRLAARGLAGADRGEMIVGVVSAALAALAALTARSAVEVGLGAVAMASGLAATYLSASRARARRDFVRSVEAGAVAQFRVDATPAGKVLLRVTSAGAAYRVSDFVEEIARLDEEGAAGRTRA